MSGPFDYFPLIFIRFKNVKRLLHIIAFSLESIISSPSKRYSQPLRHSWSLILTFSQQNMSSSSSSSQDSNCPSPTMAEIRANAAALNVEPMKFSPQRSIATENQHAQNIQRSSVTYTGKISGSPSSVPPEIRNKEDIMYVEEAIARIVTRILDENHIVPGISVPLNQRPASPSLAADPDVTTDVMTSDDHIQATHVDSDTLADFPVKAKGGISGSQDEKITRTGTSSKKYRAKFAGCSKCKRTPIAKKRKAPEPAKSDQASGFKIQAELAAGNVADAAANKENASSAK